jgi:REP element-mobilizing transposase RayT
MPNHFHLLVQPEEAALLNIAIEKIRNSVNRQAPFGYENWRDEICERLGLEATLRRRGWQMGRKRNE